MSMGLFDMISKRHLTRRPYCAALVPAAGKSERMGGTDKLTAQLGGIPVLERTLLALDGASLVDEIVVAVSPERLEELAALCARVGVKKPLRVVEGGASRAQSVLLAALVASEGCELLAVHDGARPLILPEQVDEMIQSAVAELKPFDSDNAGFTVTVKGEGDNVTAVSCSAEDIQSVVDVLQMNADDGAKAVANVQSDSVLILIHALDTRATVKKAAQKQYDTLFSADGNSNESVGGNATTDSITEGADT